MNNQELFIIFKSNTLTSYFVHACTWCCEVKKVLKKLTVQF